MVGGAGTGTGAAPEAAAPPSADWLSAGRPRVEEVGFDTRLRVQTPEHVELALPLAGLGSRFAALFLDGVILLLALAVTVLAFVFFGAQVFGPNLAQGLGIFAAFLVFWGYFFGFEAFNDGRTPGKRAFGLRTVHADGSALSPQAAAIRNLVRIVDVQPGVACLLGGFVMLVDTRHRRLGDLAAGSLVVRELPAEFPEVPEALRAGVQRATAPPRLPDAAFAALDEGIERLSGLKPARRHELAARFAKGLASQGYGPGDGESPQAFVQRFHAEEVARRSTARKDLDVGSAAALAQLRAKRERWLELKQRLFGLRAKGLRRLDGPGVSSLAAGLRELSADLARARTYRASERTVFALERVLAAAHARLYRARGGDPLGLVQFLAGGFAAELRAAWKPLTLAGILIWGPAVLGFIAVASTPTLELSWAGEEIVRRADVAMNDPTLDYRDTIWPSMFPGGGSLAAQLIANNVQVSFLCFAGGVLLGIGSAFLALNNGLHLGTAMAVFFNRGSFDTLFLWLAPHGAVELFAIQVATCAGLVLGGGFWFPGRRTRAQALADAGRRSVRLMLGVIALLILAGLIEGFFTPSRLDPTIKYSFAALMAVGLATYVMRAGRPHSVPNTAA